MMVKPKVAILDRKNSLAKGLILDLPFTEKGGSNVKDTVGLVRKSFTYETYTPDDWTTSPYGPAMVFGPSSSTRRLVLDPTSLANNVLDVVSGLTIEGIWRFTNGNQFGFLTSYTLTGASPRKFNVTRNSGTLECRIQMADNTTLDVSHSGISTNVWIHTFMTYDRTRGRSYLNGKLQTESANTKAIYQSSSLNQFSIGADRDDWNGGDLYGNVALFRMWNRGLTMQEVAKLTSNPFQIYRTHTGFARTGELWQ